MSKLLELLEQEYELSAQLKELKEKESKLRREICLQLLEGKAAGTHKFEYPGLLVKATKGYNYALDQEKLADIIDKLPADQYECLNIKYALKMGEYKNLEDTDMLDECITVSEAMPTLTIEHI